MLTGYSERINYLPEYLRDSNDAVYSVDSDVVHAVIHLTARSRLTFTFISQSSVKIVKCFQN